MENKKKECRFVLILGVLTTFEVNRIRTRMESLMANISNKIYK